MRRQQMAAIHVIEGGTREGNFFRQFNDVVVGAEDLFGNKWREVLTGAVNSTDPEQFIRRRLPPSPSAA